jgi:hypothetical protein
MAIRELDFQAVCRGCRWSTCAHDSRCHKSALRSPQCRSLALLAVTSHHEPHHAAGARFPELHSSTSELLFPWTPAGSRGEIQPEDLEARPMQACREVPEDPPLDGERRRQPAERAAGRGNREVRRRPAACPMTAGVVPVELLRFGRWGARIRDPHPSPATVIYSASSPVPSAVTR